MDGKLERQGVICVQAVNRSISYGLDINNAFIQQDVNKYSFAHEAHHRRLNEHFKKLTVNQLQNSELKARTWLKRFHLCSRWAGCISTRASRRGIVGARAKPANVVNAREDVRRLKSWNKDSCLKQVFFPKPVVYIYKYVIANGLKDLNVWHYLTLREQLAYSCIHITKTYF